MRLADLMLMILAMLSSPAGAQTWTTEKVDPVWRSPPVIGDGVDRSPEVSSAEQGGDPPALAKEPAPMDEIGYRRGQWLTSSGIYRLDQREAKFRLHCNFSHFGMADPILAHGNPVGPHHHTFFNPTVDENTTYASLRRNPRSTCSGGPLNATAYWEPTLLYEVRPGAFLPVKPNIVSFYYTVSPYSETPKLYRLLRGMAFIGGVDPSDRYNVARLREIPTLGGWDKKQRYNGWNGWMCIKITGKSTTEVRPVPDTRADYNPQSGMVRQLVNDDGSDPWGGACEPGPGYELRLVATVSAPSCWDGRNLTSPNGRDHFRYEIRKADNSQTKVCPSGWWKVPHFEAKTEFANLGHAWRSKLHLSSDRMAVDPAKWHPQGSTFHFDWINGWDSVVQRTWLSNCVGVAQNGTPGAPLTCGDSTISGTQRMLVLQRPPNPALAQDPVIVFNDFGAAQGQNLYGAAIYLRSGVKGHNHQ